MRLPRACKRLPWNCRKTVIAGVLLAVLSGSAIEVRGADRPSSLDGVRRYSAPANEGADLIGQKASRWEVRDWINSEPLTLEELRGKVVLVRWWTAPGCPFCEASAPALNEFSQRYGDRGLVVIGFYHHKSAKPLSVAHVKEQVRLGFACPVAIDPDWTTLRRWWLAKHDRGWTSVTILLDRRGVIRHVHPGGAFFKGENGYDSLQAEIEKWLAEPSA
jgi:thiol-disulfide isomerase/thioredoxin